MLLPFRLSIFIMFVVLADVLTICGVADDSTQTVIKNASKGWGALETKYQNLNAKCRFEMEGSKTIDTYQLKKNKDCLLLNVGREENGKLVQRGVFAFNSRYGFKLNGVVGEATEVWTISEASVAYKKTGKAKFSVNSLTHNGFESPWRILTLPSLKRMVTSSGFEVLETVDMSSKDAIKIKFNYLPGVEENLSDLFELPSMGPVVLPPSVHGTFTLASKMHWAMVDCDVEIKQPLGSGKFIESRIQMALDYVYESADGTFPILKEVRSTRTSGGTKAPAKFTFENVEFEKIPDSEFTLNSFGLPEIKVEEKRPFAYYLFAFATLFLLIGFGFWKFSGKGNR
jgi:hypothetical protein